MCRRYRRFLVLAPCLALTPHPASQKPRAQHHQGDLYWVSPQPWNRTVKPQDPVRHDVVDNRERSNCDERPVDERVVTITL